MNTSEHHILAQNRTSNMSNIQKSEQFENIELFVPRLVFDYPKRALFKDLVYLIKSLYNDNFYTNCKWAKKCLPPDFVSFNFFQLRLYILSLLEIDPILKKGTFFFCYFSHFFAKASALTIKRTPLFETLTS